MNPAKRWVDRRERIKKERWWRGAGKGRKESSWNIIIIYELRIKRTVSGPVIPFSISQRDAGGNKMKIEAEIEEKGWRLCTKVERKRIHPKNEMRERENEKIDALILFIPSLISLSLPFPAHSMFYSFLDLYTENRILQRDVHHATHNRLNMYIHLYSLLLRMRNDATSDFPSLHDFVFSHTSLSLSLSMI